MKKHFGFAMVAFGIIAYLGVIISHITPSLAKLGKAATTSYTMTLNSSNTPSTLTSSYQNNVSGNVSTSSGSAVTFNYVNAKQLANGFAELAPHGKIYNFETVDNQLTGLNEVRFTGSGTLLFRPAVAKGLLADMDPISISAGSAFVEVPSCDFFEIEAGDSGASITNLYLTYSCDVSSYDTKLLNGTYTGLGNDAYIYKLSVSNGSATLESINKASNISLNGTASLTNKTTAVFSFTNLTINMSYDGHSLNFQSKSGSNAGSCPTLNLDRLYTVENFESYTLTGQGYTNSTTKYQTTGLRSAFYADYYTGSGSGEIGGSGWPIMTSTDNSNYNSSKGHNSSKVGIFKFSNGTSMRYISMNSLYGVKRTIGKGTTISFWARGAYTNTSFNANHTSNTPMKLYAYYDSPLTPSNQTSVREAYEFTVSAGATWQRFEFSLNQNRTYYGFGFFAQQSSGSAMYVPIDDIEIFTTTPYASYVPSNPVTGVSLDHDSIQIVNGYTRKLIPTVSPDEATNKNVTWSSSNTSIATVDADGTIHGVSNGDAIITATTVDGGHTATCNVNVHSAWSSYPQGTYAANVTVSVLGSSSTWKAIIALGNQYNGLVAVRFSNTDAEARDITYNSSTKAITITTTGGYSGYSFGTITGTFNSPNITKLKLNGAIGSYVSSNGSITASTPTTGTKAYYGNMDASTSSLQSTYKRRYRQNNWAVDTSNTDRITQNTSQYVSGTSSLKLRGYTGGAVALNLNSDWSSTKTLTSIQFWVYNPSSTDISLRMWGYKAKSFGTNFEISSVTAVANSWSYVAMGFNSASMYNFQIADFTNSGVYLSFDNVYLYSI